MAKSGSRSRPKKKPPPPPVMFSDQSPRSTNTSNLHCSCCSHCESQCWNPCTNFIIWHKTTCPIFGPLAWHQLAAGSLPHNTCIHNETPVPGLMWLTSTQSRYMAKTLTPTVEMVNMSIPILTLKERTTCCCKDSKQFLT